MELHDLVRHEWNDEGLLSKRSVIWIHEHADPGDASPVVTAIAQLRQEAHTEHASRSASNPGPQALGSVV
jgi:hypothetical protein